MNAERAPADRQNSSSIDASAPERIGRAAKDGLMWNVFFNLLRYTLRIGASVALARLLFPEDFGLFGTALLAIYFARLLGNVGFQAALVQRDDIRDEHFDTVFCLNISFMGTLAVANWMAAPFVAGFFGKPEATPIMAVLSIDFLCGGIKAVPAALLTRRMAFKHLGLARTIGTSVNLCAPIILACTGFGVWSLVAGRLLGTGTEAIATFTYARWKPRFRLSLQGVRDVFSFGAWVYATQFLSYFIQRFDQILITKYLGTASLGFYERALNLMTMPRKQIQRTANNVLFSAYSRIKDDNARVLKAISKVVRLTSLVGYPLMIWMFFAAPALIELLYGAKWRNSVAPFQIMCVFGILGTLVRLLNPVILAKGVVRQRALRELIQLLLIITATSIGLRWGLEGIAWGLSAAYAVYLFLMVQLVHSHIGGFAPVFFRAQLPAMVYGGIQIAVLALAHHTLAPRVEPESWIMLVALTALAALAYLGSHLIFRFKEVDAVLADARKEWTRLRHKLARRQKKAADRETVSQP